MSKVYTKFKEYIWLVNTIYKAKSITLHEINERWMETDMSEGIPLSRTSFYRHKNAIEDIFGIYIECDKRNENRYYIGNTEVLEKDSVQNWMLSTLSVGNIVSECQSLYNRIILENIPSGDETLRVIIKAMRENRRMMVCYQRYNTPIKKTFSLEPYCLKLFSRRWYLLGRISNGWLVTYALDRLEVESVMSETFKVPKDFSAEDFFKDSYGIFVSNELPVEHVVIRAYGVQPYYLKDLPLHWSQREIKATEDYMDFEMVLKVTNDFKARLLSMGEWVEVLEPQSLVDEMQEWLRAALGRYQKRKKFEDY